MERAVYLHGALGEKYGRDAKYVSGETTQQLFQGLVCMLGQGFKRMIKEGTFRIYRGKTKNRNDMSEAEVGFPLGLTAELNVYPIPAGRGKWGQAIVGIILIVVGVIYGYYSGDYKGAAMIIAAGVGQLVGGIMAAQAAKPLNDKAASQAGLNPSFIFNGTVNVTEEGGPMPVVFGRVNRASSIVLSAGLSNKNIV